MTTGFIDKLIGRAGLLFASGLLAFGMSLPLQARFGDEAVDWLNQMATAMKTVSYKGTFVYIHDDQAETMQVFHRVDDGQIRERLVSLNGSAREVIRDADSVRCYLPDDKTVFVEKRHEGSVLARGVPLNAAEVGDYYDFELHGSSRIAGRMARLIAIVPKDGLRYGYKIWLDKETALPLRSELLGDSDQLIEKMMFTEIEIGVSIPDDRLEATVDAAGFTWLSRGNQEDVAVQSPLSFSELPAGFEVTQEEARGDAGKAYHVVISDGLASVSVFAEPYTEGTPALDGLSRLGAVSAYGARLGDHQVTVVGEVPEAAVTAIGKAARIR
ncbi:MAG: MucB/RseB C-terminal domain-containing protein [Gammaproteobacteria bacterium]|nr:MucB/RseB C-terminal domain-containing protein [Gammaproteobacteria bacterium]